MKHDKVYIAIDLKSFYASVECAERGLDPMNTNLVVADSSKTEKTICLAVSPTLKKYKIPGRARLFEVLQRVEAVNKERMKKIFPKAPSKISYVDSEVQAFDDVMLGFITAPPRMALYMQYSTRIYNIYLKYIAPEDMHIYSVDEVFMDVTAYLKIYKKTPEELARMIIKDVLRETGITATVGIGTNLYLCKVAMDIVAKKMNPDENGVRIARLDEMSYRRQLWEHTPITDFWRVGQGYAKKLWENGIYTMGDIALCSMGKGKDKLNEDFLYKLFGINAELLIDHAWGWEPCTIADIKKYTPENRSLGSGQVLQCAYSYDKARVVIREMADLLALDLVEKKVVTNQLVLNVGYDVENISNTKKFEGEVTTDRYGRKIPKQAHGSENLESYTSSARKITEAAVRLFDRIADKGLSVRRMYIAANHVIEEKKAEELVSYEQMDLFTDYGKTEKSKIKEEEKLEKEKNMQRTVIEIRKKYGKNAILKGMNLQEGATARERNNQIGGHKA